MKESRKSVSRFTLMDYMAFIGGAINLVVIGYIVSYWFMQHG